MWLIDLIVNALRAQQRKERERRWHFDIKGLLMRKHERRIKQRAETKRKR